MSPWMLGLVWIVLSLVLTAGICRWFYIQKQMDEIVEERHAATRR